MAARNSNNEIRAHARFPLRLGVNIDHVATIRNARGGAHPDPVKAARLAVSAGADGITAHLREDRRHIRDDDIARLKAQIHKPLNFEMAATPEMVAIAVKTKPHAACLVPERRQERTTEGGLDVVGKRSQIEAVVAELKASGIRVSLFIAPDEAQIEGGGRGRRARDRDPHRRLVRGRRRRPYRHRLGRAAAHRDRGTPRQDRWGLKSMPAMGSPSRPPRRSP